MISPGKYRARGTIGALVESSKKQTPAVQVIMEVIDGEHSGSRHRWDGWLSEKAAPRTLESLRLMGWRGDNLDNLEGIDSYEVEIVIEHEWNDEKQRNYTKVAWVNAAGGGAKINEDSILSKTAASALSQRFVALARGTKAVVGKPASAPARPAAQTQRQEAQPGRRDNAPADDFAEDDLPF